MIKARTQQTGRRALAWRLRWSAALVAGAFVAGAFVAGCVEGEIAAVGPTGDAPQGSGQGGSAGSSPGGGAGAGAGAGGSGTTVPGTPASPLRRLSNFEYNNVVRDLLGTSKQPADAFVDQDREAVFDNNVDNLGVSDQLTEQYLEASEALAEEATQPGRIGTILGCAVATASDACVRDGVQKLAARAYRRPLESAEVDDLMTTYAAGKGDGVASGVSLVIARILSSPYFLYWDERGVTGAAPDNHGQVRLSPHEVASRLSRLLVASMPDADLTAAAAADQLRTPEQRLAQARRLLRGTDGQPTAAARAAIDHVHAQWLDLPLLGSMTKKVSGFDPSLGPAMRAEVEAFLREIVWGRRDAREILTADYSYLDAKVAALYGIDGVSGSEPVKVSLDPDQRSGLLTQPGILALTSSDRSSPIHRAAFILGRIACAPPGSPPANAPKTVPTDTPGATARAKFEALTAPPACASCHEQLNGLGFTFDQYDALGRFRTVDDDGKPLDTSGKLVGTDVDGPVDDALGAVKRLAESDEVRACLVRQWYRYASGRFESSDDQDTMTRVQQRFESSGNLVEEILLGLVADDEFSLRVAP